MDETKLCPFCAETIKVAAIVCPYCREKLVQEKAPPDPRLQMIQGRAAKKAEALAAGRIAAAPRGPGPFTGWTWAWMGLTVLNFGIGFAALPSARDREGCIAALVIVGAIFFLCFIASLAYDFSQVPPSGRTTPEQALKAFYGAIRRRQYGRAYACVSPLDRTADRRSTVRIDTLSVGEERFPFDTKSAFGRYWRTQAGLDTKFIGGYHKGLRYTLLEVTPISKGVARARVELRVGGYPSAIILGFCAIGVLIFLVALFLRKEETFEVQKLLYEKDGLWWFANGEFTGEEDVALAALLPKP